MIVVYDIAIIGGGINGVGIALEAVSRGLSVLLCEQSDLANGTSSRSSKLAHGGLRYLEHSALGLVKESLSERDKLISNAPHLVQPIPFTIPIDKNCRSEFILKIGLLCYDLLNFRGKTKRSHAIKFDPNDPTNPIKRSIKKGLEYYDCTMDDARLVVSIAQQAKNMGAHILTRTTLVNSHYKDNGQWDLNLQSEGATKLIHHQAKVLVNATGPWIENTLTHCIPIKSQYRLRQVKGSHILVPKLYAEQRAYLLQHLDNRVIFTIPYCEQFTLIGTTDFPHVGDAAEVDITQVEIDYLMRAINHYFHHPIKPQDIVATWSGVRALWDDDAVNLASISRESKVEVIHSKAHPPIINIFGGKLTTYRALSEKVIDELKQDLPHIKASVSKNLKLPGAFSETSFIDFMAKLAAEYTWLPASILRRMAKSYGVIIHDILSGCQKIEDLGIDFGHGLLEKEVCYLMEKEWACNAEDILWRRSKLGLFFQEQQIVTLEDYMQKKLSAALVFDQSIAEH
tara:strand:- start:50707 stop:52242 length:1536 start_codon:yes stop_codon:yes gene_type:complete